MVDYVNLGSGIDGGWSNYLEANRLGYNQARQNALDTEATRKRDVKMQVGNALASGDQQGALNASLRGGDFDTASTLRGWNESDQDRALKQAQLKSEKLYNLFDSIGNASDPNAAFEHAADAGLKAGIFQPQDIEQARGLAKQHGVPQAMSIYAGQVGKQQELIKQQLEQRQLEAKQIALGLRAAEGNEAREKAFLNFWKDKRPDLVSQYLTPEGEIKPGARETILGLGGQEAEKTKYGMSPQYYTDENGNLKIGQLSSSGGMRPVEIPGKLAPSLTVKDTGTEQTAINSRTGQVVSQVTKNVEDAAQAKERGEARGKAEGEKPAKFAKATTAIETVERQHQLVSEDIDRALNAIDTAKVPLTGGFAALQYAPFNTPQKNLALLLEGIKANIGFDFLQQMRESSPTGGALGQVTERELSLLQSVWGSVEQSQTETQLKYNLNRFKKVLADTGAARRAAYGRDFADLIAGGGAPASSPRPAHTMSDDELKAMFGVR